MHGVRKCVYYNKGGMNKINFGNAKIEVTYF